MNTNIDNKINESDNKPTFWKHLLNFAGKPITFLAKVTASLGLAGLTVTLTTLASGVVAPIVIATALAMGVGLTLKNIFSPTINATSSVDFVGTFPEDKLFTSYAVMPIIFLDAEDKHDSTKTERKADYKYPDVLPDNLKATGYCKMKYQVAFGYEDVQEMMGNEALKQMACAGQFDDLPVPGILSKLPLEMADGRGSFSKQYCEEIESQSRDDGTLVIDEYIIEALDVQTKTLDSLIEKSQKALGSFIRINCPAQNI